MIDRVTVAPGTDPYTFLLFLNYKLLLFFQLRHHESPVSLSLCKKMWAAPNVLWNNTMRVQIPLTFPKTSASRGKFVTLPRNNWVPVRESVRSVSPWGPRAPERRPSSGIDCHDGFSVPLFLAPGSQVSFRNSQEEVWLLSLLTLIFLKIFSLWDSFPKAICSVKIHYFVSGVWTRVLWVPVNFVTGWAML